MTLMKPPNSNLLSQPQKWPITNAQIIKIQVEPLHCTIQKPRRKVRKIVSDALAAPSVEFQRGADGAIQLTRRFETWVWEEKGQLNFSRGHLPRVMEASQKAGLQVRMDPVIPNELQYVALRSLQKRPFRTSGEHIGRFTGRIERVYRSTSEVIVRFSGVHKIPVDRQYITSRFMETGLGTVLPRLLIIWETKLACNERVLKLCGSLNLRNTSRFLFNLSEEEPSHGYDKLILEQMCGPKVWHEIHGWYRPNLGVEKVHILD